MKLKSLRKPSVVLSTKPFGRHQDWAKWLKENHSTSPGVWLQLAKKGTGIDSVLYEEAVETALALIKAGKMKPAGLDEVERAKRDGRWDAAYDSAGKSVVPGDFQSALDGNARARDFFAELDGRNRYAVVFRVQTAKTAEMRAKRISQFMKMLERREKVHP
jgi:uncharacterized protein YdeI (YjbR/CyaY-like superfamily)